MIAAVDQQHQAKGAGAIIGKRTVHDALLVGAPIAEPYRRQTDVAAISSMYALAAAFGSSGRAWTIAAMAPSEPSSFTRS